MNIFDFFLLYYNIILIVFSYVYFTLVCVFALYYLHMNGLNQCKRTNELNDELAVREQVE